MFSTTPELFAPFLFSVHNVEVGPVFGDAHATAVGDAWCKFNPSHSWTGHWWTTIPGSMSAMQFKIPASEMVPAEQQSFSTMPGLFDRFLFVVHTVQVGPLFSNEHATAVGDAWCKFNPSHSFTGHWWTTTPGAMSVLQVEIPVTEPAPGGNESFSTDQSLFGRFLPPTQQVATMAIEVGPIYSHEHAYAKAEEWTVSHPSHRWNGHWWTTVPGKMSVLAIDMPMSEASEEHAFGTTVFANEDASLFDAIQTAPVRLSANKASSHSDNFVVLEDEWTRFGKPNLFLMEGSHAWISWEVPAFPEQTQQSAQIIVSYAASDPRPLKVVVDDAVVADVCDGTTGGFGEKDTLWRAHIPFKYDWRTAHTVRLEGDSFFPHIKEFVLVPCTPAEPADQIISLVGMLNQAVSASDTDVTKALGLIDVLRQTADQLAGSLVALQHKNESIKRAAGRFSQVEKPHSGCEEQPCRSVPSPPVQEPPTKLQNTSVHKAVCCDGCGMHPIVGVRYKCMNCPDYDLCESCEAQGVHDHHVFLKLKQPLKVVHKATWTTEDDEDVHVLDRTVAPSAEQAPIPAPLRLAVAEAAPPPPPAVPKTFHASFVQDITIEDGTIVPQGSKFVKMWRLKNNGEEAWPHDVELQPVGDRQTLFCNLHGSTGISVASIQPGEVIDVSVDMMAKHYFLGDCTMYFRLVSPSTGLVSGHHFWVTVHVTSADNAATHPPSCARSGPIQVPSIVNGVHLPTKLDFEFEPAPTTSSETFHGISSEDIDISEDIERLHSMGFWDDIQTRKALVECNHDIGAAVDWLLAHMSY